MKNFYLLFFLLSSLISSSNILANEVTVKGWVKYSNGTVAKNIEVKISIEAISNTVTCTSEKTTLTNANGAYSTTISCSNTDILKVRVSLKNCEGQTIFQVKEVPLTKVVEANFSICQLSPPTCSAKFTITAQPTSSQGFPFKFNSSTSEISAGDEIVERIWKFGQGAPLTGNVIDPMHVYTSPGVYTVCLTTRTSKGCTSTKCETVAIKAPCRANFTFEKTSNGIRFNGGTSYYSPNDEIVSRTWNFGDGTPIVTGNIINPLHAFLKAGTYTVCLAIRTKNGCESKECKQVIIQQPGDVCAARFSFERLGPKKFRFNSSPSIVGANDAIIERQWDFGDGTAASNEINPAHEYSRPGTYTVCLKIKTSKGCESKFCVSVKAEEIDRPENSMVKIISLYPTPVHSELKTIVFSKNNNIPATIAVVNVYGETKWSKQVNLLQGNNPFEIPASGLLAGPYFFKVITAYGTHSKSFYKL